jgi:hypothetical protein
MSDDKYFEETEADEEPEQLDLSAEERRLVTQPYDLAIRQVVADVQSGKILLIEVPYQREYVWDDAKASRLIESLLLNVPIPVCYYAENEDATWDVIDGLQRTHSIVRFVEGDFKLRGLSVLSELNGRGFFELAGRDQRRIETRTIRCVVITEESHPDIKFDVFERLNTGAVKLTPQELRNCIYRGTFNDRLKEIAKHQEFRKALGRERDPRMRDEEMVLRFFALHDDLSGYKPPLSQYLNEYMRINRRSKAKQAAVKVFIDSMRTVHNVLGTTGFRMLRDGDVTQNVNRALFDAVSLSFAFANRKEVVARKKEVVSAHRQLLVDDEFAPLVGRATADRSRMHGRVRMYADSLQSAGVSVNLPDLPEE